MEKCLAAILAQKRVVDSFGGGGDAERQITRRQRLRQAQNIRTDLRMLAGEHPARAPESGEDFIGDHQYTVAVAQLADARHEFRRPHDHAARGLQHGFDQYRRHRAALFGEPCRQVLQAVDAHDRKQQRRERACEDGVLAGRHRAHGVAVIGVPERHQRGAPRFSAIAPVLHGHLDGRFHRGRAVVGIEDARESGRNHLDQTLGQFHRGPVRASREHHVFELARLLGQRRIQLGMRMPVNVHPP